MPSPTITAPTTPLQKEAGSKGRAFSTDSTGAATAFELDVYKWSFTVDSKNQMVGNNRDGRLRIPGNVDITGGKLSMYWDEANEQCATAGLNLRHGGTIYLQLNPEGTATIAESWRFVAIIDDVMASAEFDKTIDYEVSFSLMAGTVKYPGD